ncbi:hypothetical protein BT96DRAFT_917207, partial [Gymnopus androsaceus JB14]
MELQAANILNEAYCKGLREQLAFREGKKDRKGKGRRLMGDGLPVLLSGNDFYERVVEFDRENTKKEKRKEAQKANKEGRKAELEEWKNKVQERQVAV